MSFLWILKPAQIFSSICKFFHRWDLMGKTYLNTCREEVWSDVFSLVSVHDLLHFELAFKKTSVEQQEDKAEIKIVKLNAVRVRACMRACMRACVCVCACVCVWVYTYHVVTALSDQPYCCGYHFFNTTLPSVISLSLFSQVNLFLSLCVRGWMLSRLCK